MKRKLGPKLIYSPFLRLVLFNPWFRLAFGAMALAVLSAGLALPKIWRSSPEGFLPEVRISGLDKLQNWSLKRTAREYMRARDYSNAAYSWQAAIAQDPGDRAALRGSLENCLQMRTLDRALSRAAVSQMAWLLRLTGTNAADLELAARVCEKFEWHDVLTYFCGPAATSLTPAAEAAYLKALFHQNRMAEFEKRMRAGGGKLNDPELPLYRLAFEAGWRNPSAIEELERARETNRDSVLITRLLMAVYGQRENPIEYGKCLDRLALQNEAAVTDHARYWALLAAGGRKAEAIALAEAFSAPPATSLETIRLADIYYALGLTSQCRAVLKRFAPEFAHSPDVWVTYAALLEKLGDWDEMRAIAMQIRELRDSRDTLWGYSYFLEGKAELARERKAIAEMAFDRAAESNYEIAALGFQIAKELTAMKFPAQAARILGAIEPALKDRAEYWETLFDAGFALLDESLVLKAAERFFALNPDDPQAWNRYAATLILNRKNPEEAIRLTLDLVGRYPNSAAAVINHCLALLLNQRTAEALERLERLPIASLKPLERSACYLALFEAYFNLKRWDQAWQASDKIALGALFPVQRKWLDEKRKQMPQRLAGM